jgi:alanine racemase
MTARGPVSSRSSRHRPPPPRISTVSRPVRALVSRRAIAANIAVVRRFAPASRVWAVLKADAYGHGLARVASRDSPALADADGIAILETETAAQLRELGWQKPILLLEGCFDAADLARAVAHDVTVSVHHDEQVAMIAAARPARPIDVYLKMNSGMNRLGYTPDRYRDAYARLRGIAQVGEITLATHFANADRADGVADQLAAFERGAAGLDAPRSLANSAAVIVHPATHGAWVRPGVMIYGASPFAARPAAEFGLKPAMRLESALIATQDLQPGDPAGYGHRWVAEFAMRLGVVACGYADGYPRVAPPGTPVAVGGVRTRIVGRVSMDMLTVDLTPVPGATVGTPVELWGEQIPVDEVAQAAGTVGYELMCAVAPRVPFTVVD